MSEEDEGEGTRDSPLKKSASTRSRRLDCLPLLPRSRLETEILKASNPPQKLGTRRNVPMVMVLGDRIPVMECFEGFSMEDFFVLVRLVATTAAPLPQVALSLLAMS